ncbi:Hypothetical predicted protein [Olea europaea subsp. europaea]|uniref:Uncharacterized protein n=1 Tax=Olea europaea subsp. europaea TaxID=158383 RepID=A0A8S0P8C9_OLEEU|nr:Hypothetical predicted protein [Olea europaea subsp. europaea]
MQSSTANSSAAAPSKRLLFDRRYGWVLDEWKDPSEEALTGGRGMFCILPIAKGLLKTVIAASQSISAAASSTLKGQNLPPEDMLANLNHQVHKVASSIRKPQLDLMPLKRNFIWKSASCSSHLHENNNDLHNS